MCNKNEVFFTICDMFILCGSEKFIISLAVYDIRLPALQNWPLPLPSSSKTANWIYLQCVHVCYISEKHKINESKRRPGGERVWQLRPPWSLESQCLLYISIQWDKWQLCFFFLLFYYDHGILMLYLNFLFRFWIEYD